MARYRLRVIEDSGQRQRGLSETRTSLSQSRDLGLDTRLDRAGSKVWGVTGADRGTTTGRSRYFCW